MMMKTAPVAPVVQLITAKPSDVGTWVRISAQSHGLGFSLISCPTSGERLYRGYTRFDFTVDEEKGRWILLALKNKGQHPRRKVKNHLKKNLCGLPPVWPRLVRRPHINRKVESDVDIFPPDWGMLRRSRCVQIFLLILLCGYFPGPTGDAQKVSMRSDFPKNNEQIQYYSC